MSGWLLFALFIIVGLGMFYAGAAKLRKEKEDPESVKIYGVISIIGVILAVAAILMKFVF